MEINCHQLDDWPSTIVEDLHFHVQIIDIDVNDDNNDINFTVCHVSILHGWIRRLE